jgi:vacuolar protein sorting-associated protein 51
LEPSEHVCGTHPQNTRSQKYLLSTNKSYCQINSPNISLTMSTIASPRVSTSVRSPSSTRTSFEAGRTPTTNQRRNRAALREFYGLKGAGAASDSKSAAGADQQSTLTEPSDEDENLAELDKQGFDAEAFVNNILSTSGLEGVLKVEADLVSRKHSLWDCD